MILQSPQEALEFLSKDDRVFESFILVREVKTRLDFDGFNPQLGIKIWLTESLGGPAFYFTLSHYVHTPDQAGPYRPGTRLSTTENEALEDAISRSCMYIPQAISNGHKPVDSWMVVNEDF